LDIILCGRCSGFTFGANRYRQLKPTPGNGLDNSLVFSVVTDGHAHSVDPRADRAFRYDPTIPNLFQNVIPGDQFTFVSQKQVQQIENLRFGFDRVSTGCQFVGACVQNGVGKIKDHATSKPPLPPFLKKNGLVSEISTNSRGFLNAF
jgi:hypothetical protein